VTSLDPRTPHQPEKLQELSKNDYGFTPSDFCVNRKKKFTCTFAFNQVQPLHRRVQRKLCNLVPPGMRNLSGYVDFAGIVRGLLDWCMPTRRHGDCENPAKPLSLLALHQAARQCDINENVYHASIAPAK
jgi:hypothetical protein